MGKNNSSLLDKFMLSSLNQFTFKHVKLVGKKIQPV